MTKIDDSISRPDLGTYRFGEFHDNDAELDRLVAQATVAWPVESAVLDRHSIESARSILDLACGPGAVTRRIASKVPSAKVVGVDLNPLLLDRAERDRRLDGVERIRFVEADCHHLPFADDTFDFVYARFLFQHLGDPVSALREARRVLRPGGRMLIVDVDDRDLRTEPILPEFEAFTRTASEAQAAAGGDRHIGGKLTGMLTEAGFDNPRGSLVAVGSDDIGLETCWNITTRFKLELMPETHHSLLAMELDGMLARLQQAGGRIMAGVHEVTGEA